MIVNEHGGYYCSGKAVYRLKKKEQIIYKQKQQRQKSMLTLAASQSTANSTPHISSPTTGTNSSVKIINSNARVNGHHDVNDDGGNDDVDNK